MTAAATLAARQFETLELDAIGTALTITVSRPAVLNALSPLVIAELREVFGVLRDRIGQPGVAHGEPDWSIRGVILTGSGSKSFIAGADIAAMREMTAEQSYDYAADAQELTSWIETLPVPVVAAVNGFALGGGCELAMACDYILASANASFGQPEVGLGIIPGFGGCVRLQQYIGIAAARELIFTGRRIDASEAAGLGLVRRVYPDIESLGAAAQATLALIAQQSPVAVATAKRTIRAAQSLPTDEGLLIERDGFAETFTTADMIEGTSAFVEKRRPDFPGR